MGATTAGVGAVSIPAGGISDAVGSVSSAVSGAGVDLSSIASAVSTASRIIAVGPEGILSEGSKAVSSGLSASTLSAGTSQYSSKNLVKGGGGYLTDGKGNAVTRGQGYSKFTRKK